MATIYNTSRKHVFHLLTDCSNSSSSSNIRHNKNRNAISTKYIYTNKTQSREFPEKQWIISANNKLIIHFIDEGCFILAEYVSHFMAFDSIRIVCILYYLPLKCSFLEFLSSNRIFFHACHWLHHKFILTKQLAPDRIHNLVEICLPNLQRHNKPHYSKVYSSFFCVYFF